MKTTLCLCLLVLSSLVSAYSYNPPSGSVPLTPADLEGPSVYWPTAQPNPLEDYTLKKHQPPEEPNPQLGPQLDDPLPTAE